MVEPTLPGGVAVRRRPYLPALDGLRALAVLLVLWTHVPRDMPGYPTWLSWLASGIEPGYLGVDLFFVLSGFLITRILLVERDAGRPLRWFLLRRALRIFPIYYLLLLALAVLRPGPELPWCALYLGNFWLSTSPLHTPLRHTWSLCVEEHFYLLWPLLLLVVPRSRLPVVLLAVVLPGAVLAAVTTCAWWPSEYLPSVLQYGSQYRCLSLAAGGLLALFEVRRAAEPPAVVPGPFVSAASGRVRLAVVAALLLAAAFVVSETHLGILLPTGYAPFAGRYAPVLPPQYLPAAKLVAFTLACTALLLLTADARPDRWPGRLLASAPMRGIGRISYGLYLYHYPIYFALLGPAPAASQVAVAVTASFAVATLSYLLLERPILNYAARFR